MEQVRATRGWLEVFKFLRPRELLEIDGVSSQWKAWSRCDEVWKVHLIVPPRDSSRSFREVCRQQLFRPQFIANVERTELYYPLTQRMKRLKVSEEFIQRDFSSWISLPEKVFYCGGEDLDQSSADCFLLSIRPEDTLKMPNMLIGRMYAGLAYFDGSIYVFGGLNYQLHPNQVGIRECEKLTLSTKQWTSLPNMSIFRCSFVPALLKSSIYIAGGIDSDTSVEVFSIITESFQTSAIFHLNFSNYETTAVAMDNSLVIVKGYSIYQYDILTGALMNEREFEDEKGFSPAGAIECSGAIYFNMENTFWTISRDLVAEPLELE